MTLIPLTLTSRRVRVDVSSKINHMLYMDNLKMYARKRNTLDLMMNTVRIFSGDNDVHFGLNKYAISLINREKILRSEDMIISNGGGIRVEENSKHRYLGVLEDDTVKAEMMKQTAGVYGILIKYCREC